MSDHDDRELVDRVRSAWGRPDVNDRTRAEFDAQLRRRLRQPQPRRWALTAGAFAAVAAVAMLVFSVRDSGDDTGGWIDVLAEAQAVAHGEHSYSDTFDLFDDDLDDSDADPVWDVSADTAWDGDESLELGYEYEVLAYWLASPTDGDDAANTKGVP